MNLRKKPSGIWVVDYDDGTGARRRVSTGLRDKAEATKRAREIVLGIDVEPAPSAPKAGTKAAGGMDVAELFRLCQLGPHGPFCSTKMKSQRSMRSNVKILLPLIGAEPLAGVTYSRLQKLQTELLGAGYAPATVKRKMDTVGSALTFALKQGWVLSKPPMPSISVENTSERILEPAEEAAVFAAIDARVRKEPQRPWLRFRHLVRFLLDTGCRLGEPLQARLDWIETHQGKAVFAIPASATKTNKARGVPLSAAVVETLPYLRITAVDGKLFPMSAATAWYMWDTIRADVAAAPGGLNIDDVKLHTFRHTCLTRLLRGGLALHLVSKWAGHANVQITIERYAKVNTSDLLCGADILDLAAPSRALSVA